MGFSLNKISPITFDIENPQIPVNCGTKGRAPTSTPREKRVSWNAPPYDKEVDMNEAHHKPQGNASYNPDESVTNKNVLGRFVPPKVGNMPTQPQQQQQSSSEEGSKENTILNGPRHQKEMGAQGHPSGPADSMPQGPAPTAPTHTSQTGGPPWAPQSTIRTEITRIHQNAMEPPMDPPEHLHMVKAQDPLKERTRHQNLALEHHQVQVLLHNLLDHLKTQ